MRNLPICLPLSQSNLDIVKAAFENRYAAFVVDHFLLGSLADPNEALRVLAYVRESKGDTTSME